MPVDPRNLMKWGAWCVLLSILVPVAGVAFVAGVGYDASRAAITTAVVIYATLLLFVAGVVLATVGFILRGIRGGSPPS